MHPSLQADAAAQFSLHQATKQLAAALAAAHRSGALPARGPDGGAAPGKAPGERCWEGRGLLHFWVAYLATRRTLWLAHTTSHPGLPTNPCTQAARRTRWRRSPCCHRCRPARPTARGPAAAAHRACWPACWPTLQFARTCRWVRAWAHCCASRACSGSGGLKGSGAGGRSGLGVWLVHNCMGLVQGRLVVGWAAFLLCCHAPAAARLRSLGSHRPSCRVPPLLQVRDRGAPAGAAHA